MSREPVILGHRRLDSGQTGAFDLARQALPDVVARSPRWVFSMDAVVEVCEFFSDATQEERKALVSRFVPRPEMVVEFGGCCVVYVQRSSELFDSEVASAGYSAAQVEEGTLARVFIKSSIVEGYPSETEAARSSQAIAHLLYVARSVAADRYVDKVAESRVRRRMSGARRGELTVRWDAPTLRYRAEQAVAELREREQHERQARCLHSVREFVRMRRGKVEYVRAHTRGDASVPRRATKVVAKT